jgi:hypothetical protein
VKIASEERFSAPLAFRAVLVGPPNHLDVTRSLTFSHILKENVHVSEGAFTYLRVRVLEEFVKD